MQGMGETSFASGNARPNRTTPPETPPWVSLDGRYIRYLRAKVDTAAPTGVGNGGGKPGTAEPDIQRTNDPSNGAFSIVPPSCSPIPTSTLQPKQEWEGRVTAIREDEFDARLLDLTAGDEVDRESATFGLEEVGDEDRAIMRVGSLFRWIIGYERTVGGTRRSVSQIVFLDPPRLTERDLARGREWAAWLLEEWNVE